MYSKKWEYVLTLFEHRFTSHANIADPRKLR